MLSVKTLKKESKKGYMMAKEVKKKETKKETKKNLGGRPPKEIDYKTLDECCFIHCTGEEICNILGIDYDTLNNKLKKETGKGFSEYFAEKSAGGKKSLRRRQYHLAQENATMSIWLGKNILKQSDINADDIYKKEKAKVKAKLDAIKESAGENSSAALTQYIEQQLKTIIEN